MAGVHGRCGVYGRYGMGGAVFTAGTAPRLAEDDDRVLGDEFVDLLLQGGALFRRLRLAGEHGSHRRAQVEWRRAAAARRQNQYSKPGRSMCAQPCIGVSRCRARVSNKHHHDSARQGPVAMQLGVAPLRRGDAAATDEAAGSVVNVTALLRTSVPSLMLRGERHTGTNFLDAIVQYNFRRAPRHQGAVAALAAPHRARQCYNFFGVSSPCYVPHGPFSGCVAQCADATLKQCANPSDRLRIDSASALRPSSYCCWKHGALDPTCRYTPRVSAYVIAVREPYAWLAAMHREPYEYLGSRKLSFAEFLRRPYAEKPPYYLHRTRHADPVAIWAKCVRSYFALPPAARLFVQIDDLFDLVRLGSQLSPLLLRMGFVRRPGLTALVYPPWATGLTKYNKYWGRFDHAGFVHAKLQLSNRSWAWQYTQADLDYINARIPEKLLVRLGMRLVRSLAELRAPSASLPTTTLAYS